MTKSVIIYRLFISNYGTGAPQVWRRPQPPPFCAASRAGRPCSPPPAPASATMFAAARHQVCRRCHQVCRRPPPGAPSLTPGTRCGAARARVGHLFRCRARPSSRSAAARAGESRVRSPRPRLHYLWNICR
jgi:hypothetical protein